MSKVIGGIDPNTAGVSIQRAFAAAIAGGTASVIGGGKFKNGAITGAFSRIFNDDSHPSGFEAYKKGFKEYFSDQERFLAHSDALTGAQGPEAQQLAQQQGALVIEATRMFVNDVTIEYNGELINVRSESLSGFWDWVQENPAQFSGRFSANALTVGVSSIPFRGSITASIILGGALTTTSGIGAALKAIDSGMQNPAAIISAMGGVR